MYIANGYVRVWFDDRSTTSDSSSLFKPLVALQLSRDVYYSVDVWFWWM